MIEREQERTERSVLSRVSHVPPQKGGRRSSVLTSALEKSQAKKEAKGVGGVEGEER